MQNIENLVHKIIALNFFDKLETYANITVTFRSVLLAFFGLLHCMLSTYFHIGFVSSLAIIDSTLFLLLALFHWEEPFSGNSNKNTTNSTRTFFCLHKFSCCHANIRQSFSTAIAIEQAALHYFKKCKNFMQFSIP